MYTIQKGLNMYKKTVEMDDIHIFRYKKSLVYKKQDNKEYEKKLHEKKLQLLKNELLKNI